MTTGIRGIFVVLVIAVFSACADDNSAGSESANSYESMLRLTMDHDDIEREYFVHVPPGNAESMPVVLAIHGYTSTATGFAAAYDLNAHADANGYIVVYPQGSHFLASGAPGSSYRVTSWNDLAANIPSATHGPHCTAEASDYPCPEECGSCKRCDWTSCYDDLGFIEKVLDQVTSDFPADPEKFYLLGVSNGGMMTLRLGCDLAERFAAIAPIIGQLAPGHVCGPDVDIPMLHLFGAMDDTVRFDGTPAADGFIYTSAAETAKVWADTLSCDTGPARWENKYSHAIGVTCSAYSDCRTGQHEVVSCMDPQGKHEWPGQRTASIPATCVGPGQYDSMPGQAHCPPATGKHVTGGMDLIWDFFSRYPSANQ